jgi:hypothetical protein
LLVKIKRDLENQIRGLLKKSWPGHRSGQDEHVCPARC